MIVHDTDTYLNEQPSLRTAALRTSAACDIFLYPQVYYACDQHINTFPERALKDAMLLDL